jgi:hypothetical protein
MLKFGFIDLDLVKDVILDLPDTLWLNKHISNLRDLQV